MEHSYKFYGRSYVVILTDLSYAINKMLHKISFHEYFNVKTPKWHKGSSCKNSHPKYHKTTNFDRFGRGGKTNRFNRVLYNAIDHVFVVFPRESLASYNSNPGSIQPRTLALCSLLSRTMRLGTTKDSIFPPGTSNVARNTANFLSTRFTQGGLLTCFNLVILEAIINLPGNYN